MADTTIHNPDRYDVCSKLNSLNNLLNETLRRIATRTDVMYMAEPVKMAKQKVKEIYNLWRDET